MSLLNKLFGKKEDKSGYLFVTKEDLKNYHSGDKVRCSLCNKDITVYLAERHSIATLSTKNSPKSYAIQFDDSGDVKPFDMKILQNAALRCVECSAVFCWNCSGSKNTQCPACGCYGQPHWFTHLRTSPLYSDEYIKLYDYAISLHKTAQYVQALQYYRNVLSFPGKVKEEAYSDGATILTHMGNIYDTLQQFQKAINHYEIALTILRDSYGNRHLTVATLFNNTGLSYLSINPHKSKEYVETALTIMRKELGMDHPQTKQTQTHLDTIKRNLRT